MDGLPLPWLGVRWQRYLLVAVEPLSPEDCMRTPPHQPTGPALARCRGGGG